MRTKALLVILVVLLISTIRSSMAPSLGVSAQSLGLAQDYAGLFELVKAAQAAWDEQGFMSHGRPVPMLAGAPEMAADARTASPDGAGKSYSETNIQVAGVDEADIIKTDGRYLYLVSNNRLVIVDVGNPAALAVVTSIPFVSYYETEEFVQGESPLEIYLDIEAKRLVLLVSGHQAEKYRPEETEPADEVTGAEGGTKPAEGESSPPATGTGAPEPALVAPDVRMMPPIWYYYRNEKQYVTTYVYDISHASQPQLLRQVSQEGHYLTSRRIGTAIYVASNTYSYWPMPMEGTREVERDFFPQYTTGDPRGEWNTVPAPRIAVVPEGDVSNQLTLAGIDTVKVNTPPDILSVLGSSGTVYASTNYLYVATWHASYTQDSRAPLVSTDLYRFRLNAAKISAAGQARVPGAIINQFAMDEHKGYFRIATTTGDIWSSDPANTSRNNIYVLDANLQTVGQVTGLAPGESIKSARFMGDQAHIVTFRTVDPLFVIDLSQPTAPKVLGELKIPGYSTYLHPYDEGLLLGFGYDVGVEGDVAYNLGIKISLFDVSDFYQPREISTLIMGGAGSYADVLYNHKSLLFSRELNLIAFPALLTENLRAGRFYGMPVFQGLLILTVDGDSQIQLRGHVSHAGPSSNPYGRAGGISEADAMAFWHNPVQRAAYIDDTLLTISSREVRASHLYTLDTLGKVELPGYDDQQFPFYRGGGVFWVDAPMSDTPSGSN